VSGFEVFLDLSHMHDDMNVRMLQLLWIYWSIISMKSSVVDRDTIIYI
jgi:hypothetical protein